MKVHSCTPIIPSKDLSCSLKFWIDGLGFKITNSMGPDNAMKWCLLEGDGMQVMLNIRDGDPEKPEDCEGIRMYWNPNDLEQLHAHLKAIGFNVSELWDRDYGMREFFVDDLDGFNHCFGVPIQEET